MTASMAIAGQPDAVDLEDELLDFTGDLLAFKANEHFLVELFSHSSGQWIDVKTIVPERLTPTVTALEVASEGQLQVTWLSHPEMNEEYCLVLFFMESLGWDHLAVYHRGIIRG
jgi:hypothetical protein